MLQKAFFKYLTGCLLFILLQFFCFSINAQVNREYELKVAWIYKFAKYVEWAKPFVDAEVFSIGLLDNETEIIELVNELKTNKNINGRQIELRIFNFDILAKANGITHCDMFFISKKNQAIEKRILTYMNQSVSIVVGETKQFAEQGGCIAFFTKDNRLLYKINRDVLKTASYKIDPQLLRIATIVETSK